MLKKIAVVFLFLLMGAILGLGIIRLQKDKYVAIQPKKIQESPPEKSGKKAIVSNENNVEVSVNPPILEDGKLIFDISFNTHTVALDFNPKNISFVKSESQKETPAISWEGSEDGGHHRSGRLIFPAIAGKNITVIIRGVADVKERIFNFGA